MPASAAPSRTSAVIACAALLLAQLVTGLGAVSTAAASPAGPPAHYVTLAGGPGMAEWDPGNDTIYVPVQCATSYCQSNEAGKVVDVVNAATCNATSGSGCRVVATAPADGPLGAAVDPTTGTVYVFDNPPGGTATISLLDGRTCNGTVTRGCQRVVGKIAVGANAFMVAGAVDAATRTLYVASPSHGIYVVDIAKCNDLFTTGCGQHPAIVKDDRGPGQLDVDTATNTVYAADQGNPNLSSSNGGTVTVIDGNTCDASEQSGCGTDQSVVPVGNGVSAVAVDQATNTVYVADSEGVSLIDGERCSSLRLSGCHATTHAVPTGAGSSDVVVDSKDQTVFALDGNDDTLSSINAATCNANTPNECPALAPSQREAPEVGPGAAQNDLIVTPGNQTAYAVNEGGQNVLVVTAAGGCTALDRSGCLALAPSVPDAGALATLDPATATLYVTDENLPQVDVIDAARCDPERLSGCAPVAKIPTGGPDQVGSVDDATHTLYISEAASKSVAVIDTAVCNATDFSGCGGHHASARIGGEYPNAPLLDEGTGALYVPYGATTDKVAVVATQACNAEVTSGCNVARGTIDVPEGTYSFALDPATDTLYGAVSGNPFASGNDVVVINGASAWATWPAVARSPPPFPSVRSRRCQEDQQGRTAWPSTKPRIPCTSPTTTTGPCPVPSPW